MSYAQLLPSLFPPQTLCALIRGVHQKNKSTSGFDIINMLMGFDKAELCMKVGALARGRARQPCHVGKAFGDSCRYKEEHTCERSNKVLHVAVWCALPAKGWPSPRALGIHYKSNVSMEGVGSFPFTP